MQRYQITAQKPAPVDRRGGLLRGQRERLREPRPVAVFCVT